MSTMTGVSQKCTLGIINMRQKFFEPKQGERKEREEEVYELLLGKVAFRL